MKINRIAWLGAVVTVMAGVLLILYSTVQATEQETVTAAKVVHGTVLTNTGVPVKFTTVTARRIDRPGLEATITDGSGQYEMLLSEGLWALTPHKNHATQPKGWLYPFGPQIIHFDPDNQAERKHVAFRVIGADATVSGIVELPGGGAPPFDVIVKVHTSAGHGLTTTVNAADGTFAIDLPHGNYALTVHPDSPDYAGPAPLHVHPHPNQTVDVGTITLVERDVSISGTVRDEGGTPVEGVHVVGWSGHPSNTRDVSDNQGLYELNAFAGEWRLFPAVPYTLPYIYTGEPISLSVEAGEVVTAADFTLTSAPNLVVGQLVDPNGDPVEAAGHAHAHGDNGRNGSGIQGDSFEFYLPDGTYALKVNLAAGANWLPGSAQEITVSGGDVLTIEVPLQPQNAVITGALWDPRREVTVKGVNAVTRAKSDYATVGTTIQTGNGTYRLGVGQGLWHLAYRVDPASNYVGLNHHTVVPLEENQTLVVPLRVARRDATVSGTVLDPSGQPLPGAVVTAGGLGPVVDQLRLRAMTDAHGNFSLDLPHGHYAMWVAYVTDTWLHPAKRHVVLHPNQTVSGITLQFQESDVTVSGTTSIRGTSSITGTVHIWSYTPEGAATKTEQTLGETYTLNLLRNSRWAIGAVLVDGPDVYGVRTSIGLTETSQTLDLVLDGPHPLPAPVAVTFDADEGTQLNLADGTQLTIPGGAIPVSGQVTLHALPIGTFPHQHHARLYKYGYAFIALDETGQEIKDSFLQEVEIIFTYDEHELHRLGLREGRLKPAYFSTTTDSWTVPDTYAVDTHRNTVTLYIDHFTDYSLINGPETHTVMLPVMSR